MASYLTPRGRQGSGALGRDRLGSNRFPVDFCASICFQWFVRPLNKLCDLETIAPLGVSMWCCSAESTGDAPLYDEDDEVEVLTGARALPLQ